MHPSAIFLGVWSLWAMFYFTAWTFGFDAVVEALGGLMDRLGMGA